MSQISKSPSYLIRNPHSYCFRINIPKDLQPIIRKRELRRSLKTGYLSVAKAKARVLAGNLQTLFRSLRKERAVVDFPFDQIDLMLDQISYAVSGFTEKILRQNLDEPLTQEEIQGERDRLEAEIQQIQNELSRSDYSRISPIVLRQFERAGMPLSSEHPRFKELCREFQKAEIKRLKLELERERGDYSTDERKYFRAELWPIFLKSLKGDEPGEPDDRDQDFTSNNQVIQATQRQQSITFEELLNKYIEETSRSAEWKPATEKEYRSLGKMTSFILGPDLPVSRIDHQTVNRFKEVLQKIPSGAFRYNQYRGKSLEELLKIKHDNHLSVARINGYLTSLGAVFRYAERHGYMEKNFAEGLKLKQRKRANKQQNIFGLDDLKTMFSSPDYIKDTHAEPHRFWLPVLGLFTGCRLEELCQLYLDDIRQIEGLWCLDLKEDRSDQSLKTASSERVVPLHPFLIEDLDLIGFAKKLESRGETRLFPELNRYQNKYSHYASKWFSDWKTKVGIQAPPREKTFHSFRHTFTDNLKQQLIELSIVDELTGHAIQGESFGRYGKPYRIKTLLEEGVMKLDYGIDLSHLKNSKWVPRGE